MEAPRRKMFAFALVALGSGVAVAVTSADPASGRALTLARAEAVARKAVVHHPSYERIESRLTGLRTRRCRRARGSSVRCKLYVVVPSPCALGSDPDAVCVQALWERRWLVEVRAGRRAPSARIVEITAGPSTVTG